MPKNWKELLEKDLSPEDVEKKNIAVCKLKLKLVEEKPRIARIKKT